MILVTGGTGLVGSHLLYNLTKNKNKVRAIYRSDSTLDKVKDVFKLYENNIDNQFKKIEWIKADITDITSLKAVFTNDITHVYHCAALVTFNPKKYQLMRKINIEGTANIVNFCIDNNIEKLCHVSSIATLPNNVKNNSISEKNEWSNNIDNCYAITKHGAEMEVWRGTQEGVDMVMVNPGVILGSGFFETGSGKLFSKINNSFPFYTDGVTGFVGVKDVVLSMITLMESNIKNERFIIISENKSFKEVFFSIADHLHKKRPSIKIGKIGLECFWRLENVFSKIFGKEPLITKSSARASYNKEFFSNQKIKDALNFNFTAIEQVIITTCKEYLKNS